MTKTLETLIRLHQFTLDERRRELKEVQEREDALKAQLAELAARVEKERQMAAESPEYGAAYSRFVTWARDERRRLERAVQDMQPELEQARDRMAEAFAEKKRVEITRDNRQEEEEMDRKHREQIELDEVGMQRHRRLQEGRDK